jgi:succinate dehydrogenase / fumarate reductase iron-sulfur subunit
VIAPIEITIHIARSADNQTPSLQSYVLDVEPKTTILDCLNRIKWEQNGSLAFRKNCRNAICGSCAIQIIDRNGLDRPAKDDLNY